MPRGEFPAHPTDARPSRAPGGGHADQEQEGVIRARHDDVCRVLLWILSRSRLVESTLLQCRNTRKDHGPGSRGVPRGGLNVHLRHSLGFHVDSMSLPVQKCDLDKNFLGLGRLFTASLSPELTIQGDGRDRDPWPPTSGRLQHARHSIPLQLLHMVPVPGYGHIFKTAVCRNS